MYKYSLWQLLLYKSTKTNNTTWADWLKMMPVVIIVVSVSLVVGFLPPFSFWILCIALIIVVVQLWQWQRGDADVGHEPHCTVDREAWRYIDQQFTEALQGELVYVAIDPADFNRWINLSATSDKTPDTIYCFRAYVKTFDGVIDDTRNNDKIECVTYHFSEKSLKVKVIKEVGYREAGKKIIWQPEYTETTVYRISQLRFDIEWIAIVLTNWPRKVAV